MLQGDFVLVEVGENRFFGEGNNIGVDEALGDYIVFLNNDAFVEPGWIEALSATMESDPGVAAVGPMFLYPDGRVQEVGASRAADRRRGPGRQRRGLGTRPLRHALRGRFLFRRLPHDAADRTSSRSVASASNGSLRTTRTPISA